MRRLLAAGVAGLALLVGGAVVANETLLSDADPDLWMDPTGSDTNPGTEAQPFRTFTRAYAAAALGNVVRMKCGTYAAESISGPKPNPDAVLERVTFEPESPGCVTTGNLEILVPHIELRGIQNPGTIFARYRSDNASQRSGNVWLVGVDVGKIQFNSVWNWRIADSDVGPGTDRDGIDIYAFPVGDGHHSKNGEIENVLIHDLGLSPGSSEHVDGLQFTAGENIAVRRVTFRNIYHQDILAKTDQGPVIGLTIENSYFGEVVKPGFALQFNGTRPCSGHVVRYNTFERAPTSRTDPAQTCDGQLYGNVWPSLTDFACGNWQMRWSVSFNVSLSGNPCGANSSVGAVEGKGDPARCPAVDRDGKSRPAPSGTVCDAGALELGDSDPPPTTTEPPPTTTEPPPACPTAGALALSVIAEDATTITRGWEAVPNATGYRFSRSDQEQRPHTWDGTRTSVRFGKGAECYGVEALGVVASGAASP